MQKVDIVNWNSEVATQFNLKSIPYFEVYNTKGEPWYSGKEALDYLDRLEKKAAKRKQQK